MELKKMKVGEIRVVGKPTNYDTKGHYPNGTPRTSPRYNVGSDDAPTPKETEQGKIFFVHDREADGPITKNMSHKDAESAVKELNKNDPRKEA